MLCVLLLYIKIKTIAIVLLFLYLVDGIQV